MYFYALLILGLALWLGLALVAYSLLSMAKKEDAFLDRMEGLLQKNLGPPGELRTLRRCPPAIRRAPSEKVRAGKASRMPT